MPDTPTASATNTPPMFPGPPDPNEAAKAVPDVPTTGKDKWIGAIGSRAGAVSEAVSGISGAKMHPFEESSVGKALAQHHSQQLSEARRNYEDAQTALQVIDSGKNPQTGADLTPEEKEHYTNAAQGAWAAYAKIAGVNKDVKQQLQQKKGIFDIALTHGLKAVHEIGSKLGLTPPPAPGPQQPSGATSPPASKAGTTNATVPPPPAPGPQMDMSGTRAAMADRHALGMKQAEQDITTAGKIAEEKAKAGSDIKTTDEQWMKSFHDEHGREPSTSEVEAHQVGRTERPIDAEVLKGIKLAEDGDIEGAQKIFAAVQAGAGARKGPSATGQSLMAIIGRANAGDPAAQGELKTYMQMQKDLASARGAGYGAGRAMYQIGAYVDPNTQQVVALSAMDAIERIRKGENIVPSGRLPASMIAGAQRLVKEATPAIKEVRDTLTAYDNGSDRAIFARVMTAAGKPAYGDESGWLGNVLNQAATSDLSPEGKKLVVRLARLNETIGTLRSTLGAPATDRSMALMLGLLPGPSTPDSKMAGDMINQLEQNVTNAVEIPALTGVAKPAKNSKVPPPPSTPKADPLGIR
jgi:hypothetical protein